MSMCLVCPRRLGNPSRAFLVTGSGSIWGDEGDGWEVAHGAGLAISRLGASPTHIFGSRTRNTNLDWETFAPALRLKSPRNRQTSPKLRLRPRSVKFAEDRSITLQNWPISPNMGRNRTRLCQTRTKLVAPKMAHSLKLAKLARFFNIAPTDFGPNRDRRATRWLRPPAI